MSRHFDVDATITPETGFKVSLTQLSMIVGGVFFVAVGYAYLVWGVTDIRAAQEKYVMKSTEVIADQDKKREALGNQFLASNEKIAENINKLTTLTAVQQERQKTTDETLQKLLSQLGNVLAAPPVMRR